MKKEQDYYNAKFEKFAKKKSVSKPKDEEMERRRNEKRDKNFKKWN